MATDVFRSLDLDIQRLLVAGGGSAGGDEGLFRAKDGLDKLAAKVPALKTAVEQIDKVLGAKARAAATELLNLGAINLKLRAAQARPAVDAAALAPLPAAAALETLVPQHDLEQIVRALTTGETFTGQKINRRKVIEDAAERGVFQDLRLLDLWCRAVAEQSVGDIVAEKIVPKLGEAAAARIEAQFKKDGKATDARRLNCLVACRGAGARPLLDDALKSGSAPVRAAAVHGIARVDPEGVEAVACAAYEAEKKAQEVRTACVEVLASARGDRALGLLLGALRDAGDVQQAAIASLQSLKHPATTERVLALLTPEALDIKPYKAPKAKKGQKLTKAQQQAAQKEEQDALKQIGKKTDFVDRVCQVLGKRPGDAVVERLIELFKGHAMSEVRASAARALKETGDRRALLALIEKLGDSDDDIQELAVWAFFFLDTSTAYQRALPYFDDKAIATKEGKAIASTLYSEISGDGYHLSSQYEEDEEDEEGGEKAEKKDSPLAFRKDPRWAELALRLVQVKGFESDSISIFGNLRDKRAIEPLFEQLKKGTWASGAADALVKMGDRSIIPRLVEALGLKASQGAAIYALGEMKAVEAVDRLCELLAKDGSETSQLFDALSKIGDKRAAIPVAKALLFKSVNSYPYQAIQALRALDDAACVPHVQEAIKKAKKSKNTWIINQYEELITYLERDRKL